MARKSNSETWTASEIRTMDHHTTWHDFSTAPGPAPAAGLELHTVWHVKARADYDSPVTRSIGCSRSLHSRGGTGFVALYTVGGKGWIEFRDHEIIEVIPGTLVVFDWPPLRRYHCLGSTWEHWWFEFDSQTSLPCPLYRRMDIPMHPGDEQGFLAIFNALRQARQAQRSLASALFCKLLYGWMAEWEGEEGWKPHQRTIERVIDLMHGNLHRNWTVREMAAAAHMAERTFRKAFHAATGQSPKEFYDNLRLSKIRDLLKLEACTVAEAACRFGYSSPFHLSSAFSRRFGVSPSRIGRS